MDPLATLFEHHIWATEALISRCRELSAEQVRLSLPGTYGAIDATLTHILAEDQRLLERLTGEGPLAAVTEEHVRPPDVLAGIWAGQGERWREVVAHADGFDVTLPPRGPWPAVPGAQELIVLEALQHGNDHRTHVCSVLGAHELEVPYLCGWMFWRATGRVCRKPVEA